MPTEKELLNLSVSHIRNMVCFQKVTEDFTSKILQEQLLCVFVQAELLTCNSFLCARATRI